MFVPTSFDAQTNQFPLFNPTSSLKITKLNHLNYLIWKATMVPYLKGQNVFGYVDGTLKQSSKETTTENGTQSPNPLFLSLNASFTGEVLAQVSNQSTSQELWQAITTVFASQSRAQEI